MTTNDGRELTGTLTCLDHLGNLLLFDTYETYTTKDGAKERPLNSAIVPLKLVKSCQVLVRVEGRQVGESESTRASGDHECCVCRSRQTTACSKSCLRTQR